MDEKQQPTQKQATPSERLRAAADQLAAGINNQDAVRLEGELKAIADELDTQPAGNGTENQ